MRVHSGVHVESRSSQTFNAADVKMQGDAIPHCNRHNCLRGWTFPCKVNQVLETTGQVAAFHTLQLFHTRKSFG